MVWIKVKVLSLLILITTYSKSLGIRSSSPSKAVDESSKEQKKLYIKNGNTYYYDTLHSAVNNPRPW
uniref:Secreted protein n=1 Tax=Phakopsora pachyrhizi TaxID=170000 RepID=A0A0S1MJ73_PHAPC